MSKSAKPLQLRRIDDEKWEVEMRGGKWVRCETEADAEILSTAPVLEESYLKTRPINKALAARLEKTAEKMEQYNMRTDARRFRNWVKLAKGKGS